MEIPRISPAEVAEAIRRGEHVVFLDARSDHAFQQATETIPGSIRVPPTDIDAHLANVPRAAPLTVAYCT